MISHTKSESMRTAHTLMDRTHTHAQTNTHPGTHTHTHSYTDQPLLHPHNFLCVIHAISASHTFMQLHTRSCTTHKHTHTRATRDIHTHSCTTHTHTLSYTAQALLHPLKCSCVTHALPHHTHSCNSTHTHSCNHSQTLIQMHSCPVHTPA